MKLRRSEPISSLFMLTIVCLLQGKPKREADADVGDVLTACEYFATLAEVF